MANTLVAKLRQFTELDEVDAAIIENACRRTRHVPRNGVISQRGSKSDNLQVVLSGWAIRYEILRDGSRQITDFLVAGDICDFEVLLGEEIEHDVLAITQVTLAAISAGDYRELLGRGRIAHVLALMHLSDSSIHRAWIVNLGRRSACKRIAHLLCELHYKLVAAALPREQTKNMPFTQAELADVLGLTPVHTNRMLKQLRSLGLISLRAGMLTILDVPGLRDFASFNPKYLRFRAIEPAPAAQRPLLFQDWAKRPAEPVNYTQAVSA